MTRYCLLIITAVLIFSSCNSKAGIPVSLSRDGDFMELLRIAEDVNSDPVSRYAALEPLIARSRQAGEYDWLGSTLSEILSRHPDDPYGSYYLMAMAEGAKDAGAEAVSLDYMRRLLKNFPDLEIKGQSLHLLAMGEIARNTTDPREAIAMRQEMRRLYPSAIDQGRNLYALAEEYRKIGAWEDMYRAYEDFLDFPETVIPGIPDVRYQVSSDLAFHRSAKTWTMGSLPELVNAVQYSIKTQDSRLLTRLQSDEFFLMNWSQETSDSFTHIPMTLGSLLISGIRYKPELEPFSNDREAFLWTSGWAWKIDTWYLYFRRVDYPADPEINGRWEWAGIYFGERL